MGNQNVPWCSFTFKSCLASSLLLPSSISSSSLFTHLLVPLTHLWHLAEVALQWAWGVLMVSLKRMSRGKGWYVLKEKPVQVDCQTGNVQDVCNGNAEISNYLTNLLCFSPKEDGCSGICQILIIRTDILSFHQSQWGWRWQKRSRRPTHTNKIYYR